MKRQSATKKTALDIAICEIGYERAQTEPIHLMFQHPELRNRMLFAGDLAAELTAKLRQSIIDVNKGYGVSAVSYHRLWRLALVEFMVGKGYKHGVTLTNYGRSVARYLVPCIHENTKQGPDYEKNYQFGGLRRYHSETCLGCGESRRTWTREPGSPEAWQTPERWNEMISTCTPVAPGAPGMYYL